MSNLVSDKDQPQAKEQMYSALFDEEDGKTSGAADSVKLRHRKVASEATTGLTIGGGDSLNGAAEDAFFLGDRARKEIESLVRKEKEKAAASKAKTSANSNHLPSDSFSFLAFGLASETRRAFLLAAVVFVLQMVMLLLVSVDQFYSGNQTSSNKMGVPAFVTWPVRMSQFLALLIAGLCQMDVLWSINVVYKGYKETAFREALTALRLLQDPDAGDDDKNGKAKAEPKGPLQFWWWLSALCRFTMGLFCLAVMFMLIMRSDTSRSVLLSFNAVSFIGGLDNAVFMLAKWGYFSIQIKQVADSPLIGNVDNSSVASAATLSVDVPSSSTGLRYRFTHLKVLRSLTVALICIVLECLWLWITLKQNNGDYLPHTVYVQIGDDESPALGLWSGIYDTKVSFNDVMYVSRPISGHAGSEETGIKRFRYCESGKFWTLEARTLAQDQAPTAYDVCRGWAIRSSTTATNPFNILSAANSKWTISGSASQSSRQVQMRSFFMLQRKQDVCPTGKYGPLCEFVDPCESLAVEEVAFNLDLSWSVYGIEADANSSGGIEQRFFDRLDLNKVTGEAPAKYGLLKSNGSMVLAHQRPVYYAELATADTFSAYEFIVCLGRRWGRLIIGFGSLAPSRLELATKVSLVEEHLQQVGGISTAFRYITHLSQTFDIGTLSDTGSPVGLNWYQTNDEVEPNYELQATGVLHCQCPVCPDGTSTMKQESIDDLMQVNFDESSTLYGLNLTCGDVPSISAVTTIDSFKCTSLQMASIFDCGCPYVRPAKRYCPLCKDDSPIDSDKAKYIPFPGGKNGNTTCEEFSWETNLRAKFHMRDNENYCPAWQSVVGKACGCPSPPPPPLCGVVCPSPKDRFDDRQIVEDFQPDPSRNGLHCGVILTFMNIGVEDLCTDEWKRGLVEACCVGN